MEDRLSNDTLAIVAASLTSALVATGHHRVGQGGDPTGDILNIYWNFMGELGDHRDRTAHAKG